MKTKIRSAILAFVLTMAFVLPAGVTFAHAAPSTVRVGYFAFSGYHDEEEAATKEGEAPVKRRSGYGYDFLQHLARHAGWAYDYIGYDATYDECLQMLEAGEVDLVTSVSWNAEREEKFCFSAENIGTKSTIFTVRAGNEAVEKGNYATYNGLKVGMLISNSANQVFKDFAAEHGFSCDFQEIYATEADLRAALKNKEVDGIVTSSLRALENEWLIESIDSSPFYACTRRDEEGIALMQEIDEAIEAMDLQEPDWRNVLQNKYYSTDSKGSVILDAKERSYLEDLAASGKKLTVLMNPDRRPYSYFDADGKASGIFPAIFARMVSSLSLPFEYEYVQVKGRAEYAAKRAEHSADIVIDFAEDFSIAETDGYKLTDSYFNSTHTLIKRRDHTGDIGSMAVIRYADNSYSHYLTDYVGPNVRVDPYDSLKESIDAVKKGESDATIALSYVAELFIWEDTRNVLTSELIGEASTNYALGVRAEGEIALLSLLNKCVSAFDRTAASAAVTAEVSKFRPAAEGGLFDFLQHNPVYIAVLVAGVCLLLFAIAMLIVRTHNQRQLQKRIAAATSQLEQQKEELSEALRAADEAAEQLEQQKEELSEALHAADAANRSKTTFLNNMSHDIRTPMNAIIGFTALATTHLDNRDRALDYLTKISQASNHLLSLINDVLDMSRIESGKVHIEDRPENLADILQGLRNIIQSDIHAKNLELFIDTVDVTHEEVYCDKLRLNQILLNLTSNAIKFTPSGGSVFIKIVQKPCERAGYGGYEFIVSDTGIGMSKEFMKTVFDPFTRERNSTVSGIQGTGLGMAITKNIVDIMGGTISVESEQGKGTEFTVSLELRFADSAPEEFSLAELRDLYALVVDDDLISCQSVSKMLRKIGMHAEWTVTGKEAVVRTTEAIELGHPFEVYIIDWSMPDMDGITTVRQIRAIIGDDSPIILMSAYDWTDIEQDARSAGVTGFLSKPLFASDLHRALERSLGKVAPKEEPQKAEKSFAGKRVLLAEDNELNREIAVEILQEAGFEVACAENGKIACDMLESAAAGTYDVILMDVQMPIMNGYEATEKIRALEDEGKAKIPIIAMTANAFEEDKNLAFSAGMNGHLAKPIDIDAMLSLLEKVLA